MLRIIGWIVGLAGLAALWMAVRMLTAEDAQVGEEEAGFQFMLPVTLVELERGDIAPAVALSGTVRAVRRSELSFPIAGLVNEVGVAEAEEVAQGTRLAELYSGDQDHELAAALAALELAELEEQLLIAGEREEEKRRLLAVLEAAQAEVELGRLEVERGERLLVDRIISQSEQDLRATTYLAKDKLRVAAHEAHQRAVAGTRSEDLAIAGARVSAARTRVATAEYGVRKTRLDAPWSGTVLRRFVSVGDYAAAGDPIYELADLENLEIDIDVPSRMAPRVGPQSRVLLTLAGDEEFALEHALDATIPAADEEARSFRAIVRLSPEENADRRLKPGMFVRIELFLEPVHDAWLIPSDCVLAGERGLYIVRALPGTDSSSERGPGLVADFVPVRVLAEAEGFSAIEELGPRLASGARIVATGADNAFPGAALLARSNAAELPESTASVQE